MHPWCTEHLRHEQRPAGPDLILTYSYTGAVMTLRRHAGAILCRSKRPQSIVQLLRRAVSTTETAKQVLAPLCVLPGSASPSAAIAAVCEPSYSSAQQQNLHGQQAEEIPRMVLDLCRRGQYVAASAQLSKLNACDGGDHTVVLAYMHGIEAFTQAGLLDLAAHHLAQALTAKVWIGLPACRSLMRAALARSKDEDLSSSAHTGPSSSASRRS